MIPTLLCISIFFPDLSEIMGSFSFSEIRSLYHSPDEALSACFVIGHNEVSTKVDQKLSLKASRDPCEQIFGRFGFYPQYERLH